MKEHNLFLIYLTNDAQGIYGAFIGVSRAKTKELLQKAGALLPEVGGESKALTLKGVVFLFCFKHKFHLLGSLGCWDHSTSWNLGGSVLEQDPVEMYLNVRHCLRF